MDTAPRPEHDPAIGALGQTIGPAIMKSMVPRLGRALVPIVIAWIVGWLQIARGAPGSAAVLLFGAPIAIGLLLVLSTSIVRNAFGRPLRPWMAVAPLGGVVPIVFGLYVLGWMGLRETAAGGSGVEIGIGLAMVVLGGWILRAVMNVIELQQLARVMVAPTSAERGER